MGSRIKWVVSIWVLLLRFALLLSVRGLAHLFVGFCARLLSYSAIFDVPLVLRHFICTLSSRALFWDPQKQPERMIQNENGPRSFANTLC